MKKSVNIKISFIISLFWSLSTISQPCLVNLDTVTYHGTTDTVNYMPIQVNVDGKIILSGNQKMTSTQYDASTSSQFASASTAWVNTFNTSSDKCFVVASTHDIYGNIYNVGGIRIAGGANGIDLFVMKMNGGGTTIWVQSYDGPNSTTDVGTAITVDGMGNVYVTGASDGTGTNFTDYVTIKYNSSGIQQWLQRYNYSTFIDIPTAIEDRGGSVIVSGSSGSSFTNYDFCTVSYDENSGSQLSVSRSSNPTAGAQDQVFSMAADTLGNVYILGKTLSSAGNYNIQLQKLDTALTVQWTQTFDGYGYDDLGINLTLDDSLNIYVTGFSYFNPTSPQMIILKYSNSGVRRWWKTPNNGNLTTSEGLRIKYKSGNEIFVGGNITSSSGQDLCLIRIDRNGNTIFKKVYDGGTTEKFMDLTYDSGNHIYMSARSANGALDDNIIVQYHYRDNVLNPINDTVAHIRYANNQVMVNFIKPALKMNAINNTGKLFGQLNDFVADSTCDKLTTYLDHDRKLGLNARTFPVQKIYFDMTDKDTLAESRMGDFVKVPPFYTELLITLPTSLSTIGVSRGLRTLTQDICGSQLNFLYEPFWVPNDSLYATAQSNLHPTTTYPNAHINVQKAWDYTKGSRFVNVGIYDTGNSPFHLDWGGDTIYVFDYTGNNLGEDNYGHGTQVAGIVGARSNNTLGIAGVAGGDASATGTLNTGVQMYNVKVLEPQGIGLASSSQLVYALKQGSDPISNGGMGLHVSNHSYGNITDSIDRAFYRGLNYMNRMGVAFVAARGNANVAASNYSVTQYSAPACLQPGKVMNVGASGTNGEYHKKGTNGTVFNSMQGYNLDFLAPGDIANVTSIKPFPTNPRTASTTSIASSYISFDGTSASAPHVAGVTALMMSYRNQVGATWDNIVHEDCEALLKRTATDLTVTASPYFEALGYDSISGYGRINADSALSAVQFKYKIRHIDKTHYATAVSTTTTMIDTNATRWLWGQPLGPMFSGYYTCKIVAVKTVYSYNFGSEIYLSSWPLYKASKGFSKEIITPAPEILVDDSSYVTLNAATLTSATVYNLLLFFMKKNVSSNVTYNQWLTYKPNTINSAFTLYTLGDPITGIKHEQEAHVEYFNVYPNPSTGHFILGFNAKKETKAIVTVTDIMGRVVYENPNLSVKNGLNRQDLNLTNLPKGIYLLNLEMEANKTMVKKIIIE